MTAKSTFPIDVSVHSTHKSAFMSRYFNRKVALSFEATSALLRLGVKYQIESFRAEAVARLQAHFPCQLEDWGHFFVLGDRLHYLALPIYVAACLPVTLFVLAQFPLYFDLLWATFKHVPQRSYRAS